MDAREKQIREQTRMEILDRIGDGEATEEALLDIYLARYTARTHRAMKHVRIAAFMSRMENDGLVVCTYTTDGYIVSARKA